MSRKYSTNGYGEGKKILVEKKSSYDLKMFIKNENANDFPEKKKCLRNNTSTFFCTSEISGNDPSTIIYLMFLRSKRKCEKGLVINFRTPES